MHWILVLIVVVSLIVASWFNFKWGLGLLVALALATVIFYYASGAGTLPGLGEKLSHSDVTPTNVNAELSYAGSYRVTMRLANPSTTLRIREVLMRIQAQDCKTAAATDCVTVAEVQKNISTDIPPSQSRDITTVISPPEFKFTGTPRWVVTPEDVTAR